MSGKSPSVLVSMLSQTCPQCRTGKLFKDKAYSSNFLSMHKHCPECGANLDPEPGFYWGAMYISYGFDAGIAIVASLVLYYLFDDPNFWFYPGVIVGLVILLLPLIFRYSRIVMLYAFGRLRFKPDAYKKAHG